MDEKDFEIIETLNKTKNITHAAELLFTTQSALSKRIFMIENELGAKLMLRSRQGISFTPEGEIVLEHITKAKNELQQMRESIELSKPYVSGTLNIGVSINYARYTLPDILAKFRKNYPNVTIHINTDQSRSLFLKIMNNEINTAIVRGEYPWKESKILLSRESVCAIRSIEDKNRELEEIPYINHKTDSAFEIELTQWLRENNLHEIHNDLHVDSIETCVEMVKRGLGWAIVPEICLNNFNGIKQNLYFANGEAFLRSTWLLYSGLASKLPQVKAFIKTITNAE